MNYLQLDYSRLTPFLVPYGGTGVDALMCIGALALVLTLLWVPYPEDNRTGAVDREETEKETEKEKKAKRTVEKVTVTVASSDQGTMHPNLNVTNSSGVDLNLRGDWGTISVSDSTQVSIACNLAVSGGNLAVSGDLADDLADETDPTPRGNNATPLAFYTRTHVRWIEESESDESESDESESEDENSDNESEAEESEDEDSDNESEAEESDIDESDAESEVEDSDNDDDSESESEESDDDVSISKVPFDQNAVRQAQEDVRKELRARLDSKWSGPFSYSPPPEAPFNQDAVKQAQKDVRAEVQSRVNAKWSPPVAAVTSSDEEITILTPSKQPRVIHIGKPTVNLKEYVSRKRQSQV